MAPKDVKDRVDEHESYILKLEWELEDLKKDFHNHLEVADVIVGDINQIKRLLLSVRWLIIGVITSIVSIEVGAFEVLKRVIF